MGIFEDLKERHDARAVIERDGVLVLRKESVARVLKRPTEPNFTDGPTPPCEKCGKAFAETFITTGGPMGDPDLWRDCPIAVDGWTCMTCGVFRYPRKIEPAAITEISDEGVAHGRAGRFVEAELCFTRIVWDWPGYMAGHLNLAEAVRSRLQLEPPENVLVRKRLEDRMIEQYVEAIAAFIAKGSPTAPVPLMARACLIVAERGLRDRSFDRVKQYLDTCQALPIADDLMLAAANMRAQLATLISATDRG